MSNQAFDRLHEIYIGVSKDIYTVEEALLLDDLISQHANAINKSTFDHFFGVLQRTYLDVAKLYICRIFEKENKIYEINSIPAALSLLEKNKNDITIRQRHHVINKIKKLNPHASVTDHIDEANLIEELLHLFSNELPNEILLEDIVEKFKTVRDKSIAHNENIDVKGLPEHTYEELNNLITLSKNFLSCIGFGFFSEVYEDDNGSFATTYYAQKASLSLKRLFKKIGITESEIEA